MILLNSAGRVSEATGSCLLMVRNGVVYTPPASEGALESITLDFVETIAHSLSIKFVRRPIDRTELTIADEIALCGTLAELVPVKSIDGLEVDAQGPVMSLLRERFFALARGQLKDPAVDFAFVPTKH